MSLYEDITGKKYVEPSKQEKQAIPEWMRNNVFSQKSGGIQLTEGQVL